MNLDKIEILKKETELLNLIGLKIVQFGENLYLTNNDVKNKSMLFLMDVMDSYYGIKYSGNYNENNINIFVKDSSRTIILKNPLSSLIIKKETIAEKDIVILETNSFIDDKKCTKYILISDDTIEYSIELPNQNVKLYASENNIEKVKLLEQDNSTYFNFKISKKNQNVIEINASNLPFLNVNYLRKNKKKDYYQRLFFNNSHIREIRELIEQEMIKDLPNLNEYLKKFEIYRKLNYPINYNRFKSADVLIDNLINDGKTLKVKKLKKINSIYERKE